MTTAIGERIKEIRMHQGMTRMDLSRKTGISQSTLADIEAGRIAHPKALPKIAEAFKLPETFLWDEEAFGLSWLVIAQAKGLATSFAKIRGEGWDL